MCETSGNTRNTFMDISNDLKYISRTALGSSLSVEFKDLRFSVKDKYSKAGWRQILHSISGKFFPGEFSAILGPSGAGKTSLLNILAGYSSFGVEGSVRINGRPRSDFKSNVSTYIMTGNIIQPYLTVKEAMMYAAHFKLGPNFNENDKRLMVDEVISFLGIKNCENTFSHKLSGGEGKRLAIALELVGHSSILFLDEPTTGLDDFTVKQCLDLLQKISRLGKTVICTIHQPSASLFQLFDQVYVIANGFCVYNGSPTELVSFLSTVGHPCPSTHTPADYIIELVDLEPPAIDNLKDVIQNGKIYIRETIERTDSIDLNDTTAGPGFSEQFFSLIFRMFLQLRRNTTVLIIQSFSVLFVGFLIGVLWNGMGDNAANAINICKCFFVTLMSVTYMYLYVPIILYPFEFQIMKREYLNSWYSLKAYYLASTFSSLPLLICFMTTFLTIIYVMTGQPMEFDRFFGFCLTGLLEAFTVQSLGYLVGTLFDSAKGCIIGTSIIIPIYLIAIYGWDYNHRIDRSMRFLMEINFIRHGVNGLFTTVFYNRERMRCDAIYCPFEYPERFLNFLSIVPRHYSYSVFWLAVYSVVLRIAAYYCLKFRVRSHNSKIMNNLQIFIKTVPKKETVPRTAEPISPSAPGIKHLLSDV